MIKLQEILHFFPEGRGIRFLTSFQKSLKTQFNELYTTFDKSHNFYNKLESRINNTDIIIITAHGDEEYIVGEREQGEPIKMKIDEFYRFKHSFLFSFSCSTAKLGKKICEEHNAISFIGFNDVIDLVVQTNSYKAEMSNILKSIYNSALIDSFSLFIKNNYDVSQFALLLAKKLKGHHAKIMAMNNDDVIKTFSLSKRIVGNEKFKLTLRIDLLSTIDAVSERIIVHGEPAFIPWCFISSKNKDDIFKLICRVEESKYINEFNLYYKYFLLGFLYYKMKLPAEAEEYFLKSKEVNSEYEINEDEIKEIAM